MKKWFGLGTFAVVLTALASIGLSSPAQAATNPYGPQDACHNQYGGSWSTTTDGHRSLLTAGGANWGDVYLMYNSATGYNCVAVIKSAYVGTRSLTQALISVYGDSGWTDDTGDFSYYAAIEKYAANKCVEYWGYIQDPSHGTTAYGGRNSWGNCG